LIRDRSDLSQSQESLDLRGLRRIGKALLTGEELAEKDGRLLGTCIVGILEGEDPKKVLGLNTGRTGPSPLYRQRKADRDELLCELAQTYEGRPKVRAATMARELRDYLGAGWLLDRKRGATFPAKPRRMLMFDICMTDPERPPPTSISRLLTIISAEAEPAPSTVPVAR
jgi:hypothetical protein